MLSSHAMESTTSIEQDRVSGQDSSAVSAAAVAAAAALSGGGVGMAVSAPSAVFLRCDQCEYTSSSAHALEVHQKSHLYSHISCKICHATLTSRDALDEHMRSHKIGQDFICDICGTGLRTLQKIVQHRRTHTGEKPFKVGYLQW